MFLKNVKNIFHDLVNIYMICMTRAVSVDIDNT